ncbi:MAG: molecular chaperone TorD family protein [Pseudomonadota bacterium]|nr:molecular chaperone TorD family protein [Pseudomonadota bacterium]
MKTQTSALEQEPDVVAFDAAVNMPNVEQQYRAAAYALLAALLRNPPDAGLLSQVSGFSQDDASTDELGLSMSMLGLAASSCNVQQVDDEFHDLFIGLGRGELVPYGSWYLTGFLMEKPLSRLRDDLALLGFERAGNFTEPEDHVAALCEVMVMLIGECEDESTQKKFFEAHIGSWFERFFSDLSEAKSAVFYKSVGRFGAMFTALEKRYLNMPV